MENMENQNTLKHGSPEDDKSFSLQRERHRESKRRQRLRDKGLLNDGTQELFQCRLCLALQIPGDEYTSIKVRSVSTALMEIFKIEVFKEDRTLLKRICPNCKTLLTMFHGFYQKVLRSQNMLLIEMSRNEQEKRMNDNKSALLKQVKQEGSPPKNVKTNEKKRNPVSSAEKSLLRKRKLEVEDDANSTFGKLPVNISFPTYDGNSSEENVSNVFGNNEASIETSSELVDLDFDYTDEEDNGGISQTNIVMKTEIDEKLNEDSTDFKNLGSIQELKSEKQKKIEGEDQNIVENTANSVVVAEKERKQCANRDSAVEHTSKKSQSTKDKLQAEVKGKLKKLEGKLIKTKKEVPNEEKNASLVIKKKAKKPKPAESAEKTNGNSIEFNELVSSSPPEPSIPSIDESNKSNDDITSKAPEPTNQHDENGLESEIGCSIIDKNALAAEKEQKEEEERNNLTTKIKSIPVAKKPEKESPDPPKAIEQSADTDQPKRKRRSRIGVFPCDQCKRVFTRWGHLKKHTPRCGIKKPKPTELKDTTDKASKKTIEKAQKVTPSTVEETDTEDKTNKKVDNIQKSPLPTNPPTETAAPPPIKKRRSVVKKHICQMCHTIFFDLNEFQSHLVCCSLNDETE